MKPVLYTKSGLQTSHNNSMKNIGKEFEDAIKRSVPDYALLYRLPDSAQSFGGGNNLRFSRKNPFDFLIWDSKGHVLYALEMKTVSGKAVSFERNKDEHGDIHYHQIEGLHEWSHFDGITCGFIIEFRAIETTIFLGIQDFMALIELIEKKSFTLADLDAHHIPYLVIPQKKMRTRYRYDIEHLILYTQNKEKK